MTAKKSTKKPVKKSEKEVVEEQVMEMPVLPQNPSESIIHDARSVIEKKEPKTDVETKALIDFSQSEVWPLIKEYLVKRGQRLLQLTRETNRRKMAGGANFSDAGFAFTIYDQIAAADEALINFVENPLKMKAFERDPDEEPDDAQSYEQ